MLDHLRTAKPGSIVERMLQQEAAKQQSAAAVLSTIPEAIRMSAWYEQHAALLHQLLHHVIRAVANTPAKRNTRLIQQLERAHADLKRHAALIAGDSVPVVLTRDGKHTIPFSHLAEAQAKVQILTAELAQAREDNAALKVEGWRPAFDVMSQRQEALVIQFCQEIAGRRGEPGSLPDPVRLLEMAQALYEAERQDLCPMAKGDA